MEDEELEALKARAFRPIELDAKIEIQYLLQFITLALILNFSGYLLAGFIYVQFTGGGWVEMHNFILIASLYMTIFFALLRTLRMSLSIIAADPLLLFPMRTENVSRHLKEMLKIALTFQWDLFGLTGSLLVLGIFYIMPI